MNLGNKIKSWFASEPIKSDARTQSVAWSESSIYSNDQIPQYNPDDLIGRKGFGIYKKMMIDEQVKSVVRFRRNATTGRKYFFTVPTTDQISDEEKKLRVDLFNHILYCLPGEFKSKLDGVMSAMYHGFSMTEKVFDHIEFEGKTWIGLKTLRTKPADTFEFYVDDYGDLLKLGQRISGNEQFLDINNFIHFVQNSDVHEYYGMSELREAYRAYWSKDITTRFHNMWLERMAGGFTWAKPTDKKTLNSSSQEFRDLKAALASIRNHSSLVLPSGIDLNIEQPNDTQAFERAISMHDKAIAKAMLVPNLLGLSEQGSAGSYAQSKTQLEAFLWDLDSEARHLEEVMNEQLFKHLGDINFGDDFYPKFTFKKLSFEQIKTIIELWQGLVGARVVKSTIDDENLIRNLLEIPEREEIESENIEDPEKETGDLGDSSGDVGSAGGDGGDNAGAGGADDNSNQRVDETLLGNPKKIEVAMAKHKSTAAIRRVNFSAIDRSSQVVESTNTDLMVDVYLKTVGDLVADYVEPFDFNDPDMKQIGKIKASTENKRALKTVAGKTLKEGWKIGQQNADLEIKKALGDKRQLMKKVNFASLEDLAAKYFTSKSFAIAGDMSDKAVSIVRQEILNGIQYTKSKREVEQAIYDRFVKEGYFPPDLVPERVINEALMAVSPAHKIETIVRTNSFEAINEGRISYFEDPALGGFVEAYEYSAILDGRTSSICSSLGNPDAPQIHAVNSSIWDSYKPGNHFNCRSLLIAIVQGDEWVESAPPEVIPAPGFG